MNFKFERKMYKCCRDHCTTHCGESLLRKEIKQNLAWEHKLILNVLVSIDCASELKLARFVRV